MTSDGFSVFHCVRGSAGFGDRLCRGLSSSPLWEAWLGSALPSLFSRLQNDVFDSCVKKINSEQGLKFQLTGMVRLS